VPLQLPRIETDADARQAAADVIEALAEGEVTPKEAEHVLRTIAVAAVILQSSEVTVRRLGDRADEAPRQLTALP